MKFIFSLLICWNVCASPIGPFLRSTALQPFTAPPFTNTLTSGLIAFWDFNANSDCTDATSGYVMTAVNTPTYLTHTGMGRSAHFVAASTQYFHVADNYDLSPSRYGVGNIDRTFSGWFKATDASLTGTIICKSGATWKIPGSTGTKSTEFYVRVKNNLLEFTISTGGSSTTVTGSTALVSGTWYQFVAWYTTSDRTLHIQVNNSTPVTGVLTGGSTIYPVVADGEFQIGRFFNGQYFGGDIDAIGYWKRELTSDERASLYFGAPEWPFGLAPAPVLEVVRPLSNQLEPYTLGTSTGRVSVVTVVRNATDAIEYSYGGSGYATLASSQRGIQTNYFGANVGRTNLILRLASTPTVSATETNTGVGIVLATAWQSNLSGRAPTNQVYTGPTNFASLFGNDFAYHDAYWNNGAMDPFDSGTNQIHSVSADGPGGGAAAQGSYVPLLLTRIANAQSKPIQVVPCAKGATSITNWTVALGSDSVECSHLDVTTLYGSLLYRVLHNGGANFILSHGSETDMANNLATNTFYVFCTNFNYQIFTDTGATNLMCKVQHLSESGGAPLVNQTSLRTVMDWVWAAPYTRASADFYGVSPSLIDAGAGTGADGLHIRLQADLDEAALRLSASGIIFP